MSDFDSFCHKLPSNPESSFSPLLWVQIVGNFHSFHWIRVSAIRMSYYDDIVKYYKKILAIALNPLFFFTPLSLAMLLKTLSIGIYFTVSHQSTY